VSVVITTFNTGSYLPETIDSVFAQSHPHHEVIVVDDGSSDDTVQRARAYGSRITLIERPHHGLGPARNAGLREARGDYIAFLDSDDLWEPDALAIQVDMARQRPDVGLVVADGVEFEGDAVRREHLYPPHVLARVVASAEGTFTDRLYPDVLRGCPITCPAQTLVPRHAADAVGPVCTTPNGIQDFDYYIRLARRFPFTFHAARLTRYRYRADSMSGADTGRDLRYAARALELFERSRWSYPADEQRAWNAASIMRVRHALLVDVCEQVLDRGTQPDADDLATVLRAAPRDVVARWMRTALALPHPLDVVALRATRAARPAVRRARDALFGGPR
jgi:glycosyltransferase involved in cell wall biosynthesis